MTSIERIYVFVAKDSEEFSRYPGSESGYDLDKNLRASYRYKQISSSDAIIVLDCLAEKNVLKDCPTVDDYLKFQTAVSAMVERVLRERNVASFVVGGKEPKDRGVNVFVHIGGCTWEKSHDIIKKCDDAVRKEERLDDVFCQKSEKEAERLSRQIKEFIKERRLKDYHWFAISTEDPDALLDLRAGRICLPDSEEELRDFDARGDRHEVETKELSIGELFVEKWHKDVEKGRRQAVRPGAM